MEPRKFNGLMPAVHELYVANVLGMHRNGHDIDLSSNKAVVEVKFRFLDPAGKHPRKWVVLDYQLAYGEDPEGRPAYWCLGFYKLTRPIKSLHPELRRREKLERLVTEREMYLVPWDWMLQFPIHQTRGETERTVWNNNLIYSRADCLPKVTQTHQTPKGQLHLTEGVNPKHFPYLTEDVPF
ncbi:MAG: hypothetical protein AABY16_02490 [Nanoarchaeota archaeon]